MRVFANLFLILFLADGSFSLVDELVPLLSPLTSFTEIRTLLSVAVIIMSVPLYLCLGIDRRLPKRGFKLQEERERVSIDFRKMLTGML